MRGSGLAEKIFVQRSERNQRRKTRFCCTCEHSCLRLDQVAQSRGKSCDGVQYTL
jgi:hypothetical protein